MARLNDKQKLIFKALLQGLTAKEIAKQTGLSFRTTEAHIENNWVSVNI